MISGLFVTGTDTNVGKTIISSGIAAVLKDKGMDVGVYKPMLSGVSREDPASDTSWLKRMSGTFLSHEEITPFAFKEPLAPYMAANLEGKRVRMDEVLTHWYEIREKHDFFIVEGAGGISVPLGEDFLVSDLMKALRLPIVIVARPNLGTFNHIYLTVQYAKSQGLNIAGIILNGVHDELDLSEKTNPALIKEFCSVPILGITPRLKEIAAETIKGMVYDHIDVGSMEKVLKLPAKPRT